MAEGEAATPPKAKGGKGGDLFKKYKWWIVGGGIVVILFMVVIARKGSSASSAASNPTAQQGINPSTGYLYGSPADLAASGYSGTSTGVPGPAGPTGPAGPAGPAGATGPKGPSGVPSAANPGNPSGGTPVSHGGGSVHPIVGHPVSSSYTIKPGDTLSGIAASHGIRDWHTLYSANRTVIGGNPNLIHPGQKLRIP